MNVSVFMKQTINNRIIRRDKRKLFRKQNCCLDWRQSNYIRLMLQGLWLIYSVTERVGVRDRTSYSSQSNSFWGIWAHTQTHILHKVWSGFIFLQNFVLEKLSIQQLNLPTHRFGLCVYII